MPQDIVQEEYTYSGARGNASARVSVSTSDESDTQTYRKYLEPSEIDLHFENNVEILALAERIKDRLAEISRFEDASNNQYDLEGGATADWAAEAYTKEFDDFVADIEILMEAEIAEVKAEFHDLAEALTRGRTDYDAAVAIVGKGFRPSMAQITGEFPDPYNPDADLTGAERRAATVVEDYELMERQYTLIKGGYAHNTDTEVVLALTEDVAMGLVEDALLVGAAKALKVGEFLKAVRMSRPAQAIAARFRRVTGKAKDALNRVRARVRARETSTKGPHGETVEGKYAKYVDESCPGVACRL